MRRAIQGTGSDTVEFPLRAGCGRANEALPPFWIPVDRLPLSNREIQERLLRCFLYPYRATFSPNLSL
jgi:hypothetical protein